MSQHQLPDIPSSNLPMVWCLQQEVHHYRLPIFERLRQRGLADGTYDFRCIGALDKKTGKIFGGGDVPSWVHGFADITYRKLGVIFYKWPGLDQLITQHKPAVTLIVCNPRMQAAWRIPKLCKSLGLSCFAWSKVHSYSRVAPIMNFVKRRLYRRYDGMAVYGQSALNELRQLGFDDNFAIVANNTIDTSRIFREAKELKLAADQLRQTHNLTDKIVLQCIGRMDPDKRHQDLLDAWPRLAALNPKLVMVLVGAGPMLDEIRAKAAVVDSKRIIVTGRVPDDYAWIRAADLNIYPGAVGLAINQSLAFGLPTIIADEYGSDGELVTHEVTGLRYERGNLEAMIAAVQRVLAGGSDIEKMKTNAVELMKNKVTIENMVDRLHELITKGLALTASRRNTLK